MLRKATIKDLNVVTTLALKLWQEHEFDELKTEFKSLLKDRNCAIYLYLENEKAIGFAQCQLRFDYVEGTETSPVGYLEGVYVDESYRQKGNGRNLVNACENWARSKGCKEFASDSEFSNKQGIDFHNKLGFSQANIIVCFTKKL